MNAAPCSCRVVTWRTASCSAERLEDVHRLLAGHREDVLAGLGGEALDEQGGGRSAGLGDHGRQSTVGGRPVARGRAPAYSPDDRSRRLARSCALRRSRPTRVAATRPASGSGRPCPPTRTCCASRPMSATRRRRSSPRTAPASVGRYRVRYFSPLAEVPFCGHATIATGVALGERGLAASASPDAPSR